MCVHRVCLLLHSEIKVDTKIFNGAVRIGPKTRNKTKQKKTMENDPNCPHPRLVPSLHIYVLSLSTYKNIFAWLDTETGCMIGFSAANKSLLLSSSARFLEAKQKPLPLLDNREDHTVE